MNFKKLVFLFLVSSLLWSGCKKDKLTSTLDLELNEELLAASNEQGVSFFLLPNSDDFANIPQDPRNPLTQAKVDLGKILFHEPGMAVLAEHADGNGTYSCASCHSAAAGFQAGRQQGIGDGGVGYGAKGEGREKNPAYSSEDLDVQPIRSPSAMNAAYQSNLLWNGQFGATNLNVGTEAQWAVGSPKEANFLGYEGLETQAIAGLDVHRMKCDEDMIIAAGYKSLFDAAFPDIPENERYTDTVGGLAMAAYERVLLANQAPFQRWLRGEEASMTDQEKEGAILFFGKANCSSCHTGPALSTMNFHALGMADLDGQGIYGDIIGDPAHLGRGGFTQNPADNYKFKVPQLYNLADSPFYGHGGTFTSIREVVAYKNAAVPDVEEVENLSPQFVPLNLSDGEIDAITAFLETALYDPNLKRYEPDSVLSGMCFPNNDPQSVVDLGCD